MATKPVIVGADGSRESLRAVEWAAREAALRGTSLRIVAVPPLPRRMTVTPATPGTVADVVEQSTSEALAAAAQRSTSFAVQAKTWSATAAANASTGWL